MATEAISKPELAYLNSVLSLDLNPAAPINIKKGTNVVYRLLENDFRNAWDLQDAQSVAGKAVHTLASVNAGANKVRRYYSYTLPYLDGSPGDCTTEVCDVTASTVEELGYIGVDIDKCASKGWVTTIAEFDNLNETPSERRAAVLRRYEYMLRVQANTDAINELYAAISNYADGTVPATTLKSIEILTAAGDINPIAISDINAEMRASLFNGEYVIFGGDIIAKYFDIKMLRLSPEGRVGIDTGTLADLPFVYDSQFDGIVLGLEVDALSHGFIVPIGAFMMDTWVENTGYKEMSDPNYLFTTITIDGIEYDYEMKFDECDGRKWKELLKLHYGFGSIPDSIYNGSNGLIRHYEFKQSA